MTAERVLDAIADAERRREDITVTIETVNGQPTIYVTRQAARECGTCGQPLPGGRPGRVTWVSDGREYGTYDHQHGCGQWNTPEEASAPLDDEDDPAEVISAVIAEVDRLVAEDREQTDAATTQRLRKELTDALSRLADGEDPEEVRTGWDDQPGVWPGYSGQDWEAWDYKAGSGDGWEDVIVVSAADLT